MASKRQLVALVGALLMVPFAILFALAMATGGEIILQLATGSGLAAESILGYAIESSATAGFILVLLAVVAFKPTKKRLSESMPSVTPPM